MATSNAEQIWAGILSNDRAKVLKTWGKLKDAETKVLLQQLKKIIANSDETVERRTAAQFAVDTLQSTF